MTQIERVSQIYQVFGQQGGTIHQLRQKLSDEINIKENRILKSIVIEGYLDYLFNQENDKIIELELRILENNLTNKV